MAKSRTFGFFLETHKAQRNDEGNRQSDSIWQDEQGYRKEHRVKMCSFQKRTRPLGVASSVGGIRFGFPNPFPCGLAWPGMSLVQRDSTAGRNALATSSTSV